ncbi:MAG TPA: LamG-like jellyroll fold domain-containing protein [Verrucomicrobiae bacterium]|jgi:hypothetical protein
MKTALKNRIVRLLTLFSAFAAAWLGTVPAARAGLTFELHLVRFEQGQQYKFFTPLYTNSTGPAAAFGTYFISSPFYSASHTTDGSWRELQVTADGVNTLAGTENLYPDFASLMNQITNGVWTMVFTNDTTTNTYTFSVSAANVSSNMLPATIITYPANNALNVANQPTFAWLGPTNWPVVNSTYVYNWDFSFFQYAGLPASQESVSTFVIPNGIDCILQIQNVTNDTTPIFNISTPTDGAALSGWVPTDVLESDDNVSFATTNPPVANSILVAHYTFDNSGNLGADSSGGGNDLDFNGGNGVTSTNDAMAGGGAAYFDGTSFFTYSMPPTNVLNTLAGDFSLSFWIKTKQNDSVENGAAYFGDGIVAADIPGGYEDVIPAALDGGEIGINTGSFYGDDTVNSITDINDGYYHHVVITRNEETGEKDIYIDGMLNNSDFASMNPLSDIRDVAVGCAIDASQTDPNNMNARQFFNGELDDLQLYAGILTSNQVAGLFSTPGSTLNGVNGTLIAEYDFEDTNSPGLDSSGNGNDSNCTSGSGNPNPHLDIASADAAVGQYARQFFGDTSLCFYQPSQVFNNLSNALAGNFTVTAWVNTTNITGNSYDNAYFGAPILFTYNNVNSVIPLALVADRAAVTVADPNGIDTTLHSATSVTDGKYHFLAVTRNVNTGMLKIYVDGTLDASVIGPTNEVVVNATVYLAGGYYTQYVGLLDDVRVYSGELTAQNIASLAGNSNPLGLALNATNLQWSTSGDADWFVETTNTFDDISAAQSGSITGAQSSTLSTTVTGPGTLTFSWSSIANDPNYGFDLEFNIDGSDEDDIYGDTDWYQDGPFNIPSGTHTLTWTATAYGDTDPTEAGFLDEVSFVPSTGPVITLNPFSQTNYPGYPVWLNAAATSNPAANWQWYEVGIGAISGATSSYFIPTNSGTAGVAGQYYAIADNGDGSALTETATVSFVSAPLPPDWSVAFKSPFESQDVSTFTKDFYYGCVVDANSNIYAAAEFAGNMTVGSQTLDSGSGGDAAAVVKQTPTGSALWAAAITNNGSGNAYAECVALATNGGVYVAGNYSGNNWLGANALTDAGGGDVFLACFNAGGTNFWLKTFGGPGTDFMLINTLVSDPSGNVTLAALFGSGAVQIGSSNYNIVGQQDIIIQLNPFGIVRWSQLVPSSFIQYLTYSAGRLYLSGSTAITGGTTNFVIGSISNVTDRAWAVACLDANTGNALWARGVGAQSGAGTGNPYSSGVSDDVPRLAVSGTNLFMTGAAYGPSASFGPYTVNFALPRGQYFARYDTNGNPQTATAYGSVTTTPVDAVANAAGDVYVSGYYDTYSFFGNDMIAGPANPKINQGGFSQSFLAKFDPNGNPLWAREATSPFQVTFLGVALAPDGVWASGWALGTNSTQVQSIQFGANHLFSDAQLFSGGEGGGSIIYWNPGGVLAKINDAVSVASPVQLLTLRDNGVNFQFSFTSQANFNHAVQYTTNLANPNWQTYTNVAGDGTVRTVSIPVSIFNPSKQGFVRVSTQ